MQNNSPNPKNNQRRFVVGFFVALLCLGVVYPLLASKIFRWPSSRQVAWLHGIVSRQDAIANSVSSPGGRLLLVGGSAGLFGLEAEWMEAWLGRPVINLHSYAALGLDVQLDRALRHARKADTVVLTLEFAYYFRSPESASPAQGQYLWTYDRDTISRWPLWRQAALAYESPTVDVFKCAMESRRKPSRHPADWEVGYDAGSLTPNGDMRGTSSARDFEPVDAKKLGTINTGVFTALAAFRDTCKTRGIAVSVAPPPHSPFAHPEELDEHLGVIKSLFYQNDIPFYDSLAHASPGREYFLDTPYHLRPMGRRIFTERFMENVAASLGKTLPQPTARIFGAADAILFRANETPESALRLDWQLGKPEQWKSGDLALEGGEGEFRSAPTDFADLMRRFPNHVFCLAQDPWEHDVVNSSLPEAWHEFTDITVCRIGIFGSGKFANVRIVKSGENEVRFLSPPTAPAHPALAGMRIELSTQPDGGMWWRPIMLDGDHSSERSTRRLSVVVIDPKIRAAVESLSIGAGALPRWRLRRVP